MKITVITGSPRTKGNTFAMVNAFIDTAQRLGNEVIRFDFAKMKIGGCRACMSCFQSGKACTFDDDFNLIAPHILDADAVVYAMPV
ncbi:MAG: flavodoxin family protein [Paludibacter sp.]|nr:flavodoxin family protein [Bacteroidales bacterium]MCM1069525.1 flavodoxin family protein [Prevotella sp.]MCM1354181.1 flavodoxin family protein [Bacteroides sp.]MCM1442963.1 flavodoxin family protein [Muribaculum sp.]MCM1482255.1 flavodoxin family protein [Paludibacter sp.]